MTMDNESRSVQNQSQTKYQGLKGKSSKSPDLSEAQKIEPIRDNSSALSVANQPRTNLEVEGQSARPSKRIGSLTPEQQKVEGGITGFFKSLFRGVGELISVSVKPLFSGILGAALLPFFGPVVAIGVSLGVMTAVTEIQDNLKPLGLDLQDDTVLKLVEPLQGKQLVEAELRKVIEEVLSEDRPANEDLAKAFIKLLPTINKAVAATNIEFSGPVQGLTIGDHNMVTQTFRSFLSKDAS